MAHQVNTTDIAKVRKLWLESGKTHGTIVEETGLPAGVVFAVTYFHQLLTDQEIAQRVIRLSPEMSGDEIIVLMLTGLTPEQIREIWRLWQKHRFAPNIDTIVDATALTPIDTFASANRDCLW